jgi:hypothetical protein
MLPLRCRRPVARYLPVRPSPVLAVALATVLLAGPPPARAALDPEVYVSGFVSQGYLNTEDNDYLLPDVRDGSGEFNEAAVIVAAEPLDRLHVGIQLLSRDFGGEVTPSVIVDWAYGDFRWRDQLGFRAGKIKLPYGLYNQARDVDMLRTSVLLPQSVYAEQDRELLLAYEGAGLYGNVVLGPWGDLDYEFAVGSLNVPEDGHPEVRRSMVAASEASRSAVAAETAALYGLPADSASATVAEVEDPTLAVPWILGGSLVWNTPLTGLRVGGTHLIGDADVSGRVRYDVLLRDGSTVPSHLPRTVLVEEDLDLRGLTTGSLEYQRDRWLLAAELSRMRFGDVSSVGWYASVDHRLDERWAVQAMWSTYWPDHDDRDGANFEAAGQPDYYAWQHDLGLAIRFDVNAHWLLKFEYHHMNGAALADRDALAAGETASERWRVWAAKTTFHF